MNSTTRICTIIAAATVVAMGPAVGTASAAPPRFPGPAVDPMPSAFSVPIAAVGDRCIAQYVADHMAGDRRVA